jgi:hypothetical protein
MLIRVRRGAFDPLSDDTQPDGDELWSGGDEELSAAVLNAMDKRFELGTWYGPDEFAVLLAELAPPQEHEVLSAIAVDQPGVSGPWTAAIQIGEDSAALMVCRSVVDHIRQLRAPGKVWVRVD